MVEIYMKFKNIQSSESIQLHTESFGKDSKIAYMLIAGAMAPGRFWTDEFCQKLTSHGSLVIRYDHRDIGLSSSVNWKTAPYSLADLAADAISILDAYECEAAYFIGHSMGGHICQQIALDYPHRVVGFAAISSGPIGSTGDTDRPLSESEKAMLDKTWEIFLSRKDSNDLEERIHGFMKIWKYLNGLIFFDEEMARAYTIDLLTRTKHLIQSGNNHELVMRGLHEFLPHQHNLIERIQVPALIIHGEEDPLSLPRDGKALANAIPGSKLIMVPGIGHMIFNRELEVEIAKMIQTHRNSIRTKVNHHNERDDLSL
jgi:pimeloyl-ACP methyl ester carboxylesterase